MAKQEPVKWVTINGNHIPIYEDGWVGPRTPYKVYKDSKMLYKPDIDKMEREGKITKEQAQKARDKANEGISEVLDTMVNGFDESNINALLNTMNRKLALTSDSDITGAAELYKTANGFVLDCPSTRSQFRVFMDDEGNVRRMPANEMKTGTRIRMAGKHKQWLDKKFHEITK